MSHHYEEQDDVSKVNKDKDSQPLASQPTPAKVFPDWYDGVAPTKTKVREEKFWMVWKAYGENPKVKHVTEDSANREAERIATDRTSDPVYVLEAKRVFKRASPPVERLELK